MLDCMDNYIENWGMIFIGMLECFAIGWVYHLDKQIEKVRKKMYLIMIAFMYIISHLTMKNKLFYLKFDIILAILKMPVKVK